MDATLIDTAKASYQRCCKFDDFIPSFYDNLFEPWAKDKFFPVFYSRDRVESVAAEVMVLSPAR